MVRRDKENYYLDIAQTVAERGTCLRRNFGAIIVKNDQIMSTGYAGAPRGRKNCSDLGFCLREKMQIPRGERYELCRSVHAEANAIIHASRGYDRGNPLFSGRGRPYRGSCLRRQSLRDVQTPDYKRRYLPSGDTQHVRFLYCCLCTGVD